MAAAPAAQSQAPVAPSPVGTATGFHVESVAGGNSTEASGAGGYGTVAWWPTGHATVTAAGLAALLAAQATYAATLTLRGRERFDVAGPTGKYSCLNADLAAQHAAIVAILAAPANVTGSAT